MTTSHQFIAKLVESHIDNNNYVFIEDIITTVSDYKNIFDFVSDKYMTQLVDIFKHKYNYNVISGQSKIDFIANAIKNNKYKMRVSGNIPSEYDTSIQQAYFDFNFVIEIIDKKTNECLLNVYGNGEGHHYVSGSTNTEIDKFHVDGTHYCENKNLLQEIVDFMQNNWDIYENVFGNNNVLGGRDFEMVSDLIDDPEFYENNEG